MKRACLAALLLLLPLSVAAQGLSVSQAEHEDWFYSVPEGRVTCVDGASLFTVGDRSYALDEVALGRGYAPPLALVSEQHLRNHQFAQYLHRWKQQWDSGDEAARRRAGPALVDATTPKSVRELARSLCE